MGNFAIAIHGGAQNKDRRQFSEEKNSAYRDALEKALMKGWTSLSQGQSALDAVEQTVRSFEDDPLFNAAKGAVYNEKGEFEFDAAIMCGKTLRAGAVASVKNIKNPVSLARTVMEYSNHVFLCGSGAEEFARNKKIETRPFEYFVNSERKEEWQQAKAVEEGNVSRDTVGAVALDKDGNLAAASSTGGLTNKLSGRIGDSPIIGGGIYANNAVCAVACTGDGELIMRGVYAHEVYALLKYKKLDLEKALEEVFKINDNGLKAEMGIIAIDPRGRIKIRYNTLPMYRAFKINNDPSYIAVWEE